MNVPLASLPLPPAGPEERALAAELAMIVGAANVSTAVAERTDAARDMWPKAMLWELAGYVPSPPAVVVQPGSTEEVAEIVVWARARGVPLTPYGLGSGVAGGAIPLHGGVSLRTSRLDRVLSIDPRALTVQVQAGKNGWELERELRTHGLTLGHFPSSINCSSVGGWIAARSGGQMSSRYGKIEDIVQSVTCVLGNGDVVRPRRPALGPDLLELILGSEGTLGVITDATMRVWPAPDVQVPRGYRFKSMGRALEAMRAIFRAGLRPAVLRLYDPFDTWMALREGGDAGEDVPPPTIAQLRTPSGRPARLKRAAIDAALSRPWALKAATDLAKGCLLVAVHEGEESAARREQEQTRAICAAWGARDLGEAPGRRWLRTRYSIAYKLPAIFAAGAWVDTCEVAISWSGVESLYNAVREAVAPHAFVMAHFSHAYTDGCSIYFTFSGGAPDPERGLESYDAAWLAALTAADGQGATITHHHGVGILKMAWLGHEIGAGGREVLAALQRSCDPDRILNPGKLAP